METKGSEHEGSAVDEVDMVVRFYPYSFPTIRSSNHGFYS
jgi:hypothetical protein